MRDEPGEPYPAGSYPAGSYPASPAGGGQRPGYPPGPPAYPPGPPPPAAHGNGALVAIVLAIVVLVAGTIGAAVYDHADPDGRSSGVTTPGLSTRAPDPYVAPNGAAAIPTPRGSAARPQLTGAANPPAPTTQYTPYSPPSPTTRPLDMGAVRRTVEAFFNGFQDHDLHAVRSAVCPKYRNLYQGTYWKPSGYEFNGWHATISDPVPGANYTYALVTVHMRNPHTGADEGTMVHNWVVERIDVDYYICGYST